MIRWTLAIAEEPSRNCTCIEMRTRRYWANPTFTVEHFG
jgi:hypothetical protein